MQSEYMTEKVKKPKALKVNDEKPVQETESVSPPEVTDESTPVEETKVDDDPKVTEEPEVGLIQPHYATKHFSCLMRNYVGTFHQFQVITDQLTLHHLLRLNQPIQPIEEDLVKCPNPKCGWIFVGEKNVVAR